MAREGWQTTTVRPESHSRSDTFCSDEEGRSPCSGATYRSCAVILRFLIQIFITNALWVQPCRKPEIKKNTPRLPFEISFTLLCSFNQHRIGGFLRMVKLRKLLELVWASMWYLIVATAPSFHFWELWFPTRSSVKETASSASCFFPWSKSCFVSETRPFEEKKCWYKQVCNGTYWLLLTGHFGLVFIRPSQWSITAVATNLTKMNLNVTTTSDRASSGKLYCTKIFTSLLLCATSNQWRGSVSHQGLWDAPED